MSTTTATAGRGRRRLAAAIIAAALAGALSPLVGVHASPAQAAGDVCDLCSLNFDPTACAAIGGWPYDSTLEAPPPAVSGGAQPAPAQPAPAQPAPAQPAPAQPAPAQPAPAPAAPQPAAPQTSTKSSNGTTATTENSVATQGGAAVAATVPASPTLGHEVSGRTLTLTWTAPADGGAALTGYKLVLNSGTPIEIPADATSYEIALGAGTYDAVLIATNSVGNSAPSATATGIEIEGATASPKPTKSIDASDAVAASDENAASPVTGVAVIGALVLAAGGLLAWWWIRRRSTAHAGATAGDTPPAE